MTKVDLAAQKKQTAIRNITNGENLTRIKFKAYWNDKEVFRLGVVKNPYIIELDWYETIFTDWWNNWRWDEQFVTELFLDILENHENFYNRRFPTKLLDQLPDSVRNDPWFARLASRKNLHHYERYVGEIVENIDEFPWKPGDKDNHLLDMWVMNAYKEKFFEIEKTPAYEQLLANPERTIQLIESKAVHIGDVPYALRRSNKKVAAAIIRTEQSFWGIPKSFMDDIGFVLDCLGANPSDNLIYHVSNNLSYRIRKIVGSRDLLPTLQTLHGYNQLKAEVMEKNHVDPSTKPKARLKV